MYFKIDLYYHYYHHDNNIVDYNYYYVNENHLAYYYACWVVGEHTSQTMHVPRHASVTSAWTTTCTQF